MSKLKDILLEEFSHDYKNGLYHLFSCKLAYHSNKIEGSRLSEEQTAFLFETNEVCQGANTYVPKDVEEARGHFLMFNYMLKTINMPLTEDIIKKFHYYLKFGVFEDIANNRPIGEYKRKQNFVGTLVTSPPDKVSSEMKQLLSWYDNIKSINITDLAEFHVRYEEIHPFADGNGRTGRMLLFRESLLNLDIPVIIDSAFDTQYKSILSKAQKDRDFNLLANFFTERQISYKDIIESYTDSPTNLFN